MKKLLALLLALPLLASAQYNVPGSLVTPCCVSIASGGTGGATAGANFVFAGPTTGSAAAPTFRLLTSADLPSGVGTVTSFSAGNLSPLFTSSVATSTTTPALTFTLTNDPTAYSFFGNFTGSSAAPSYTAFSSVLGNALRLDTAENKIDWGITNGSTVGTPLTGASHTFACTDTGKYFYRSNSGSAMTDTFPTCQAGFNINIRNNDASATDTITSSGNTFGAGLASSYVINFGRRTWFDYDGTSNFGNVANDSNLYEQSGTNTATHIPVFGTRPSIDLADSTYSFPLANTALANASTTVNGQTCTLGSTCTVTGAPSGTAGGDLSGTYPNPTVAKVDGVTYGATPSINTVPVVTGTNTVTYEAVPTTALSGTLQAAQFPALTGDITTTAGSVATTLATVNSNVGTFGDGLHVAAITANAKGLLTAITSTAIQLASTAQSGIITALQYLHLISDRIDVVADEGAFGDWIWSGSQGGTHSCTWTNSAATLTCPDGPFTSTGVDGGKIAILPGGGASSVQLRTTISSVSSSTVATLAVTPSVASTANVIVGFGHDDTTAINNAIAAQQTTYPDRCIFFPHGVTGRYGISATLTTFANHPCLHGIGAPTVADVGDYTKLGGSGLAWMGSSNAPMIQVIPTTGANNPAVAGGEISDMYFDGRNGDQDEALQAIVLQSVHGWDIHNIFINDPIIGIDNYVVSTLGETTDNTRGVFSNVKMRVLDGLHVAGGIGTTTGTGTFSTSSFSLAVSSSTAAWITPGYFWVMTQYGYYQLTNCTGGGGSTAASTLTGCTVAQINNAPTWVASANVIQAAPSVGYRGDGSTTGNNCCLTWLGGVIEHGSSIGPPAMFLLDTDSAEVFNLIINGGSAAAATTPLVNRTTKPGIGCYGGSASIQLECRNNHFIGGSPGVGGLYVAGLTNAGAAVSFPPAANYWDMQQQGNGEPAPVRETLTQSTTQAPIGPFVGWTSNGSFRPGPISTPCPASEALGTTAATAYYVCGTTVPVPPQGLNNLGTTIQFHINHSKTAAGTTARTYLIKLGSTGTSSDTTIESLAVTPSTTATADTGEAVETCTVTAVGASGAMTCGFVLTHSDIPTAATGGLTETTNNNAQMTSTTYSSTLPASGPEYLTAWIQTGATTAEALTILVPSYAVALSSGAP